MSSSRISAVTRNATHLFGAMGAAIALWGVAPNTALAVPVLQVYVEGATYDSTTETWSLDTTGTDSGGTVRVWVIGNVDGDGGQGEISDVTMLISYDQQSTSPAITLTGSTTGGLGGFTDSSVAADGTHIETVTDGSTPTFDNGDQFPAHGVFGAGREWQSFALGDMSLTDSPIGDIIDTFPSSELDANAGQINVYEVSFSGEGGSFHFDVYGTTDDGERHWAAPFSHDGEAHFNDVPELSGGRTGATGLALLLGCALLLGAPLRKRR